MQGFNRYYPPDYDPKKHQTLNDYHGKHALGDRARKIDKGILIVRFELPFNIWCGTCNAHIGQGVRYNAEKRKVGNYYSTPIWAFRCKCHLCSGWFEIQTDPKNTRYVVTEGAKRKEEDWDPEENGGMGVFETDPSKAAPVDPFAAVEKTTTAQTVARTITVPRLTQLQDASESTWADPFSHNQRLRARLRAEKKKAKALDDADDDVRRKYGLAEDVKLVREGEDGWEEVRRAVEGWNRKREEGEERERGKRRRLEAELGVGGPPRSAAASTSSSRTGSMSAHTTKPLSARRAIIAPSTRTPKPAAAATVKRQPPSQLASLQSSILLNTARRSDPFLASNALGGRRFSGASSSSAAGMPAAMRLKGGSGGGGGGGGDGGRGGGSKKGCSGGGAGPGLVADGYGSD